MSKHFQELSLFILAASLACLHAGAASPSLQEADRFLQDVTFAEQGSGPTNALIKLNGFLAKAESAPESRRHLLVRKIVLLMKIDRFEEAYDIFNREFADCPAEPKDMLVAYDALNGIRGDSDRPGSRDYLFSGLLRRLLKNPVLGKAPDVLATFHCRYGDLLVARSCNDLAIIQYRKAAETSKNTKDKANALFKAAIAARKYRDIKISSAYLDQVEKLPNLPYAMKKRVELLRGENAVYKTQHTWTPSEKNLADASRHIDQALDLRSPLLGTSEATRAIFALIRAEAKAGHREEATKRGEELLDGPTKLHWKTKANLAVFIGDTYYDMGDYKKSVKFYERGLDGGDPGPKAIEMRIAKAARAGKDYFRAMQAYSDAIKFCDPVEGQDEIAHFTHLVGLMNKTVRKGSAAIDSEEIFSDTNEDISDLTLDEE